MADRRDIGNLDRQIQMLMNREKLPEDEVKALCEKVGVGASTRGSLGRRQRCLAGGASWYRRAEWSLRLRSGKLAAAWCWLGTTLHSLGSTKSVGRTRSRQH